MRPLALGLLAWDYPPSASGLAVAAREIAESLVEAGHDVRVFTLDRSGHERIGGVELIGCRPAARSVAAGLRRFGGIGHLVAPAAFLRAVRRAHRERPFDLVEATNWYAPAALLHRFTAIPIVTRHSTPAALTGIADTPDAAPRSLRDRFDGRFAAGIEAYSARASGGWISNTRAHAETIAGLYGLADAQRAGHAAGRHAVAGLSLPPARLLRGRRAPYPQAAPPLRLLFVGRAERRKGFDLLTGALEILADEIQTSQTPPFEMRIVGVAARDLPEMSPRARALVVLTGRIDEAELEREYETCHGVVAPSRYESFGLVYQEALAFGRPVVALAEDASAREFIGATGAGLIAPSSTPSFLAAAMAQLLGSHDLRLALRDKALKAAGRFDRASLAAGTLALYRTVLRSPEHGAQGR